MKAVLTFLLVAGFSVSSVAQPVAKPWLKYQPKPSGIKLKMARIPQSFWGEWNTNLLECGTGLNDTRLLIDARRVRFYESDGEVRRVIFHNSRAITVTGSYSGEGQVWDRTDQLVLSRSRNDLTITSEGSSLTRQRCPLRKTR